MAIVVSHSEVGQFLSCERNHYYGFGEKLMPRTMGAGLRRGTMGHAVLETYYKYLLDYPGKFAAAEMVAMRRLAEFGVGPNPPYDILLQLTKILPGYFEYSREVADRGWKVLAVEKEFRLNVPGDVIYPFKPDLIAQNPQGQIKVVDHKFCYNFYADGVQMVMGQLPKYVGALRALGYDVQGAQLNMIRWRDVKSTAWDAHYQRTDIRLTNEKIKRMFTEQVRATHRIAQYKKMDKDEWERSVIRVGDTRICEHCSFQLLCAVDLEGRDTTLMKQVDYEPNSYGYADEDEDA